MSNIYDSYFLILAILKLVQKQFFQYQKGKLPIVVAW